MLTEAQLRPLRRWTQTGFFALFLLAPALDLFRLDLIEHRFYLFGMPWTLGIDAFLRGELSRAGIVWSIFVHGLLPILLVVGTGVIVAWKFGRLYCGWLCPHFSAVEVLNRLLRKATAKLSLWDRRPLPPHTADGRPVTTARAWWPVFVLSAGALAALWGVTLMTYLLPPRLIWHNLLHAELSANQARFIGIASLVFWIDFVFARHLFCRFGCAVGLFQSVAWMGNDRALVVSFDRTRARQCADCHAACDHACPMRLNPRNIKRRMFSCTQCAQCVDACEITQAAHPDGAPLHWVRGAAATREIRGQRDD